MEFDFLAFELSQRGLTQQVFYWRVGGKTKQNTMKQLPTCTNSRWIPPPFLRNELLKQMANIPFSCSPESLLLLALNTSSPRAQMLPLSQVWKGILLMETWPLKGWAACTAPDSWSSAPWSCSETAAGVQRTFQHPLCPVHGLGWLKPRLLPCKFMIAPHSSFFMSRKINKQHRNKQRPASSSLLGHGKQITSCCSDFSPTQGSPAGPTKPPVGHSMETWELGSAKIPLQLEGADSSWGCVVFVENFLKFSVINVYISQCWHPNFVIFPSESWEKHIKHFRLLMVSLYSEEVVRGSVYLSRTEKGLSRSHSTCQTEYIFTRNATYFQYLGCRMI